MADHDVETFILLGVHKAIIPKGIRTFTNSMFNHNIPPLIIRISTKAMRTTPTWLEDFTKLSLFYLIVEKLLTLTNRM